MATGLAMIHSIKEYVIKKLVQGDMKSFQNDAKRSCHIYKQSWFNDSKYVFNSYPWKQFIPGESFSQKIITK